ARDRLKNVGRQSPDAGWRRQQRAADVALPLEQRVDECVAVERKCQRTPDVGGVERRLVAVDGPNGGYGWAHHLAYGFGSLRANIIEQRGSHFTRKGHVEPPRDEGKNRRRAVGHNSEFDAVQIGQALLPILRIARELDRLVLLHLDELEGTGT